MKTGHTPEDTPPDTNLPDDASMLALTNEHFAEHVVRTLGEEMVPDQIGPKRDKSRHPRERAKAVRSNRVKASELPPKPNDGRRRPLHAGTSSKPLWDADQLRLKLQQYDRTPFLDILAIFMECTPTPQTIMAFADKYPDRFVKAMADLGRLGGFADKKEMDIGLSVRVKNMSDSQLEDQMRDIAYRMGIQLPRLIDVQALTVHAVDLNAPEPQTSDQQTSDTPPE